tara:strand:+ start:561 stop:1178 length:618 start_codon:yes stop_codon:yes gene_type:complete
MWALVESNSVTKVYARPKAIKVGDINYPSNIMSLWSSAELEAIGIYEVVVDNTNLKNVEYYINGAGSIDFADGVVTQSYSTATAKEIDDVLWTAEEDKPEGVSTGDVKSVGLKTQKKKIINNEAGGILAVTDWYRIREDDGGTEMPAVVLTFRTAIRTESNTMCGLIDAVADVDELAALYIYTLSDPEDEDSEMTRPLGSWSELE